MAAGSFESNGRETALALLLISVLLATWSQTISCDPSSQLLECSRYNTQEDPSADCPKESKEPASSSRLRQSEADGRCKNSSTPAPGSSLVCSEQLKESPAKPETLPTGNKLLEVRIGSSANGELPDAVWPKNNSSSYLAKAGAYIKLECRIVSGAIGGSELELRLKLRWMRTLFGLSVSQSIGRQESPAPARLKTVQRDGGLDLELEDFQSSEAGTYYCQAVSEASGSILGEAQVRLEAAPAPESEPEPELEPREVSNGGVARDQAESYSRDNLLKLLPSLRVWPSFSEPALGEPASLTCATSGLDPEPEVGALSWSFAWLGADRLSMLRAAPRFEAQLPANASDLGSTLTVWSMSSAHAGLYRCTYTLAHFNLTLSAVGELALPAELADSAPSVLVSPQLVRVSRNGSARLQCTASGWPRPALTWLRLPDDGGAGAGAGSPAPLQLEGLQVSQVGAGELPFYCAAGAREQPARCPLAARKQLQVTALSLLAVEAARAQHQGGYLCRAENRLGRAESSCLLDVELREPPRVRLTAESRHQTIWLREAPAGEARANQRAVFRCAVEAGQPEPRVRWLRLEPAQVAQALNQLDRYDLALASSATASVNVTRRPAELELSIATSSPDDEGTYLCLAENEWGRHSQSARLAVRRPASVRVLQASPQRAARNSSFQLECLVAGHPSPVDIEWSRPDRGAFFALISSGGADAMSPPASHEQRAVLKFDRVTEEDAGEYTCSARDPLDAGLPLSDSLVVLVEQPADSAPADDALQQLLPRLMVRPAAAVHVRPGANLTLDCLAVAGLQPTLVEWLAPGGVSAAAAWNGSRPASEAMLPYSRRAAKVSSSSASASASASAQRAEREPVADVVQLGSKLRIMNAGPHHEGVYQCRGQNRVGVELAPALVRLLPSSDEPGQRAGPGPTGAAAAPDGAWTGVAKTKLARLGSNIELKCRVPPGVAQLATSWSREHEELPQNSLQIEHNLWLQNVTLAERGLYICSAIGAQPNQVFQARINLLVNEPLGAHSAASGGGGAASSPERRELRAKIVASKAQPLSRGDSVTLECVVWAERPAPEEAAGEEAASQVAWTHRPASAEPAGRLLDNVFVQGNLLIIYQLRAQNAGVYQCNFNELAQSVDYSLRLTEAGEQAAREQPHFRAPPGSPVQTNPVPAGGQLELDCSAGGGQWSRGPEPRQLLAAGRLQLRNVQPHQADIYQCWRDGKLQYSQLVQVELAGVRFLQRPSSFLTLPARARASHQRHLELELKFYPETDTGLLLFGGQWNKWAPGDYLSLALSRGHLEFKFELGNGPNLLRSPKPVELNQWHWLLIERAGRRGQTTMRLDRQAPVTASSPGKFLSLDLDSVLYVGGAVAQLGGPASRLANMRGFQGCLAYLRWARQELALTRGASVGLQDCDKPECSRLLDCSPNAAHCQPERRALQAAPEAGAGAEWPPANRCICLPGFAGERCQRPVNQSEVFAALSQAAERPQKPEASGACPGCASAGTLECGQTHLNALKCHCRLGHGGPRCESPVSFAGVAARPEAAEQQKWQQESAEASGGVYFQPFGYLKLGLGSGSTPPPPIEGASAHRNGPAARPPNETGWAWPAGRPTISMADSQNISLRLTTNSSYGLILFAGQLPSAPSRGPFLKLGGRLASHLEGGDFLALTLVDGRAELSVDLGSGLASRRSLERLDDSREHLVRVLRTGKLARLIIDEAHRYELACPGKLSALNVPPVLYLGSVPHLDLEPAWTFSGCLRALELNGLGPLNLLGSDQLSQVLAARNLAPCAPGPAATAAAAAAAGGRMPGEPRASGAESPPAVASSTTTGRAESGMEDSEDEI